MSLERNLLFAVMAFEHDLLDLAQLTAICREWAEDKTKSLAELLVARQWLTEADRASVEQAIDRKLAKHSGNERDILNAITRGDVCDAIRQVQDTQVQRSLDSWPTAGPELIDSLSETLQQGMSLKTGESLGRTSRYTWVTEVGHGGLGQVWLARDNELAREVALKEIKPRTASPEAVRRLIREAQITGQLQHPNIVPVYEVNRGDRPYYTMKLVKGETLSKAIRKLHEDRLAQREDPLALPRLLNVFVSVCEALAYAHARGIIHRDLKPENIILGDFGEAIVLDWGLAKHIRSREEEIPAVELTDDARPQATSMGRRLGTPAYMAPEQAAGRVDQLDHRTDVYGLGAILFEILTGRAPHQTRSSPANLTPLDKLESVHAMMQRIVDAQSPCTREVDATISRELDAICATAMAKEREERYVDAKALAADIKRWLAHQPVSVYRTSVWERLRLWRRRNPTVAALSSVLAVSLLLGSIVSTFFGMAANREAGRANTEAGNAKREQLKATELAAKNAALAVQEKQAREQADLNADRERQERVRADGEKDRANAETKRANEETKRAQRLLYAAKMNLAQAAWESTNVGRLRQLLTETHPLPGEADTRGFEWHYWNRLANSDQRSINAGWVQVQDGIPVQLQGGLPVQCVTFSADGQRLASASGDQVRVWDALSHNVLFSMKHDEHVFKVVFSSDGKRLASVGRMGVVKVWDASDGHELRTLKGPPSRLSPSIAFSPDGQRLAIVGDLPAATVWDVVTGQEQLSLKIPNFGYCVAFNADGKQLAVVTHDGVSVWNTETGQEVLMLKEFVGVKLAAYSPDGKWLALAGIADRYGVGDPRHASTVTLCDASSGKVVRTMSGHAAQIWDLAFRPDSKRLATVSLDQSVKLWDVATGEVTDTFKGHSNEVYGVAFSPDGRRLASASNDQTIKFWNSSAQRESVTLVSARGGLSAALSPDGTYLASTGTQDLVVLDVTTGQERLRRGGHTAIVYRAAFNPDRRRLASVGYDQTIKIWGLRGDQQGSWKCDIKYIGGLIYSPDGTRLAGVGPSSTSNDLCELKVWDATSGAEITSATWKHQGGYTVAFSPDGKRLVTGGRALKMWDASTGKEIPFFQQLPGIFTFHAVAMSRDGQWIATTSSDSIIRIWDAANGQLTLSLKGHNTGALSLAFSPDSKRLASGGFDRTIKFWDLASGQETLTLKGHNEAIMHVAFSADGQRLMTQSTDQEVKLWDARSWYPELRDEQEALSVIHFLRDTGKPQSEWLNLITSDASLTEPVRQRALQFAREWKR